MSTISSINATYYDNPNALYLEKLKQDDRFTFELSVSGTITKTPQYITNIKIIKINSTNTDINITNNTSQNVFNYTITIQCVMKVVENSDMKVVKNSDFKFQLDKIVSAVIAIHSMPNDTTHITEINNELNNVNLQLQKYLNGQINISQEVNGIQKLINKIDTIISANKSIAKLINKIDSIISTSKYVATLRQYQNKNTNNVSQITVKTARNETDATANTTTDNSSHQESKNIIGGNKSKKRHNNTIRRRKI